MQVDRQPSPWPCVAMLAGLLFLCLMAPRYWKNRVTPEDPTIGPAAEMVGSKSDRPANAASAVCSDNSNFGGWRLDLGNRIASMAGAPDSDLMNLLGPPTIEDLIASRTAMAQLNQRAGHGAEGFEWPVLVRAGIGAVANASNEGPQLSGDFPPNPGLAVAMEFVGAIVGEYWSVDGVKRLALKTVDGVKVWGQKYEAWFAEYTAAKAASPKTAGGRYTVRVLGPNDRLAMLPEPRELAPSHAWCVPQVLFEQLDRLASQPESAQWASHVRNQLHALTEREQLQGDDVQTILGDLSDAAEDVMHMADRTENDRLRVELLRAHWALARRLDCWCAMHEKRVAVHFQSRVAARGSLSPYFAGAPESGPAQPDVTAMSNDLEKYEASRNPKLARRVAEEQCALKSSTNTVDRTVADAVEQHYRNANIRVAITAEMLNRMVGQERQETKPVREQIAGAFVHGQSNARSESQVLLDPSVDEWQLELSAKGVVESNTLADGGPVRFRSRGTTDFTARKSIVVNDKGVHLKQSDVDVTSRNRLVGVTTDYDWVPLFGGYARERAVGEYYARQGRVRSKIESRVESQARETLDQQTRDSVDEVRKQTYDRVASQLDEYGIKLTPVEMKTTPERLVARVRVANDKQLGSHTPRPRALSDSLASMQVHESALTNLAVTLGLDGKRYTAPELQKMLREKFPQIASKTPVEAKHDTIFEFAKEDAVQIKINNGKLELTVSFASIELQGEATPDVVVHAFYVPSVDGFNAELVRDGTLGIEGRFSSTERARLHNIFNRVLPQERHLPIVRVDTSTDKRFQGLMITQLVLEDGWAGLAVGPISGDRVAEKSRSLR